MITSNPVGISNIVQAFDVKAVGTRIKSDCEAKFMVEVTKAVSAFDWSSCHTEGQAYIVLPENVNNYVLSGVGYRTENKCDYYIRLWRGKVGLFLKRHLSIPVEKVAVVVYTKEAYLKDPDVAGDSEKGIPRDDAEYDRVVASTSTHFIVAVLAFAGPESTVSANRFVANLSGGNLDYANLTGDELREMARRIRNYNNEYCTVAD